MLSGYDIVCLSTQDWNGLWTRKQRFMQMFAREGNRVLYIETQVHLLGLDVLPGDPGRFVRFLKGPRQIEPGLHVATLPILLPFFQMQSWINAANHLIISPILKSWMRRLGFKQPLLWIYTPFSWPLVKRIDNTGAVYECVDEIRAARGLLRSSVVGEMEDTLLRAVDLTIVTQENLIARRAALCKNTSCVPNGADTDHFARILSGPAPPPAQLEALPRPRLGFVGHIHYWIDLKLIRFLAERRPSWSFVLIGPVSPMANVKPVKHLANVHFLGRQPQQDIPLFLKGIDVCLSPYFTGSLADNASPLKLYEYLAAGKPVVSTDMAEARKFPDHVQVAASYQSFLDYCDATLARLPEPEIKVRARMAMAAEHSWNSRFRQVKQLLADAIPVESKGEERLWKEREVT